MRSKQILKYILEVTLSNITTIISGIVVGFILPQVLSIEGFGFYKTFTLYVTYLGLFSLGMIDGIVLDYGGYDYDKLNRPVFRAYLKWYLLINGFFAIIIAGISMTLDNANTRFIVLSLAINLLAVNIIGYFQNISQVTQRFKELSIRKILQSAVNVIIVMLMYFAFKRVGELDYKIFVIAVLATNIALLIWYIFTYSDIVFGRSVPLLSVRSDMMHLVKIGFPLLFSNLCSTLILTLDRQFVNIFFDTETYAVYAFAYSVLSLVTVATSAISVVLYPILKRTSEETIASTYPTLVFGVMFAVFAMEIVYFPLKYIITIFLPQYMGSLSIFRIIFPGVGINSVITIVMHNYYKTLNVNFEYFKKTIMIILFSVIANLVAYFTFKTTTAISIASIVMMLIWYCEIESFFRNLFKYSWKKLFTYLLVMIINFYVSSAINNGIVASILYVTIFLVITLMFYRREFNQCMRLL